MKMRIKFSTKHLFALTLIVATAVFLQVRLNQTIAAFKHDIANIKSVYHLDAIQTSLNDYPALQTAVYEMSIDDISFNSNPTIVDYCMFRRTIKCRYKLNMSYMRPEIAHSRIPPENRVDGIYVNVPACHKTPKTAQLNANPFACTIVN